ncbi:UvrD-helicase domain-containing protein [Desulfobacter latus]|uniref:AAA family ATPase n=1 Tax=Desulfobacter latus TaxID=2292 RepID=A0A850T2L4_9BACT|nr:UvrD-helicase domain-containing protein [Desulfobacter latus]NWH06600.1 AAA family ATPase [Desulfobacter latus]
MQQEKTAGVSTSVLARKIGLPNTELFKIFQEKGLIHRDEKRQWRLTPDGEEMGGAYRQTTDGDSKYIVWPVSFLKPNGMNHILGAPQESSASSFEINADAVSRYVADLKKDSLSDLDQTDSAQAIDLTDEQERIVNTPVEYGKTIKVIAFAGTGKTTTTCEYAKKYPQTRFLYLAYNKSVQVEAADKFPSNVTCRTAHSLAYGKFGWKFKNKLTGSIKAFDMARLFDLDSYFDGTIIINILNNYMNSTAPEIGMEHFPKRFAGLVSKQKRGELTELAQEYWEMMTDKDDSNAKMLHDAYLKLYQLSTPRLDFDCILVDEAQDLNPVIFEIVDTQTCAKIYIGDSHQQIYDFRGAIDAMDIIEPNHVFYLTHSFRFNSLIGDIATWILKIFKHEEKQIIGLKESVNHTDKKTILTRTNAMAFKEAVAFIDKASLGFVGGSRKYRFSDILNVYWLYAGKLDKIQDPFYKNFNSFEAFKRYVLESKEIESTTVLAVVTEFTHDIPGYLEAIYRAEVHENQADVVFSTAHKSKGLEWDCVRLSDDFMKLCRVKRNALSDNETPEAFSLRVNKELPEQAEKYFELNQPWPADKINELNLIYVAATRAKQTLIPNSDIWLFTHLVEKNKSLLN